MASELRQAVAFFTTKRGEWKFRAASNSNQQVYSTT